MCPWLVTLASFTGLWKESSCDVLVCPALLTAETEKEQAGSVTWHAQRQICARLWKKASQWNVCVELCGGENWYSKANTTAI